MGSPAQGLRDPTDTRDIAARFPAATFACLGALLLTAPGAFANSDIAVVAGSTNTNVTAGPNYTATAANAQVGADNINGFLAAGTDVTVDTTSAHAGTGTITVNAAITSANAAGDLTLDADSTVTQNQAISINGALTINATGTASVTAISSNANVGSASLTLDSSLGDISQNAGSITVPGNTHAETSVSDNITLTSATNDFNSVSVASGATLSFRDQNALVLGTLDSNGNVFITAGGNVTQAAGGVIDPVGGVTFDVGSTHDVTVTNAGNDFNFARLTSVHDANISTGKPLDIGGPFSSNVATVSGNLTVSAAGQIFDGSGRSVSVAGTATLNSNGDAITLDEATNNFMTIVIPSASNVTLVDSQRPRFRREHDEREPQRDDRRQRHPDRRDHGVGGPARPERRHDQRRHPHAPVQQLPERSGQHGSQPDRHRHERPGTRHPARERNVDGRHGRADHPGRGLEHRPRRAPRPSMRPSAATSR